MLGEGVSRPLSSCSSPTNDPPLDEEDGGGGGGGRIEEPACGSADRGGGGDSTRNRWPRHETLSLLKIRADMDVAFRNSSVKGPLWEGVSRKMADLGYNRSGKKCKEKFENVYKYHKRTKEGRTTKPDGKTYRFFDQLEALEQVHNYSLISLPPPPRLPQADPAMAISPSPVPVSNNNFQPFRPLSAVPSPTVTNPLPPGSMETTQAARHLLNCPPLASPGNPTDTINTPITSNATVISNTANRTRTSPAGIETGPSPHDLKVPAGTTTLFPSILTSSSTSSDQGFGGGGGGRKKRKRKWKDFFQRLLQELVARQEELQKKFLEAIEKRDYERTAREEAWKMQEIARINREREIQLHERSIAAAKDAAVVAFLQKISGEQIPVPVQLQLQHARSQENPSQTQTQVRADSQPQSRALEITKLQVGGENNSPMPQSSCRWPKAEVQALIDLRTNLDLKYQESGPKGHLWEEISAGMRSLGYNRSTKRCKEKWENINKYFKKVKESNKQRPEDSKTCPYFRMLETLHRKKNKTDDDDASCFLNTTNPAVEAPSLVHPKQRWPLMQEQRRGETMEEDMDSENQEEEDDEEEEDERASRYEMVTNKQPARAPMDNTVSM